MECENCGHNWKQLIGDNDITEEGGIPLVSCPNCGETCGGEEFKVSDC